MTNLPSPPGSDAIYPAGGGRSSAPRSLPRTRRPRVPGEGPGPAAPPASRAAGGPGTPPQQPSEGVGRAGERRFPPAGLPFLTSALPGRGGGGRAAAPRRLPGPPRCPRPAPVPGERPGRAGSRPPAEGEGERSLGCPPSLSHLLLASA